MLYGMPARPSAPLPRPDSRRALRKGRRRRRWTIVVIVASAVCLLALGWFGSRVLIAQNELMAAQNEFASLPAKAQSFDLPAAAESLESIAAHVETASAAAHDPTWLVAETIPFAGDNLRAVRTLAGTVDDVMREVALPAASAASTFDLSARTATGGFDLSPLEGVSAALDGSGPVLSRAASEVASLDTSRLIEPVRSAVEQIDGGLTTAVDQLGAAQGWIDLALGALGDDGPRDYLLAFQNNAELMPLGGSAASYTQLRVDAGSVTIAEQGAGSQDLLEGVAVDVPVDASALELYSDYLIRFPNTSTSRPDFPTAAQIMRAHWARDKGVEVDGIVSVDPVALAAVLRATGPLTITDELELTADNAVQILVHDVYTWWDSYVEPERTDAFFQGVAAMVFAKVMSGDFDLGLMADAVRFAVDRGSLMLWSADPDEQAVTDGLRIQGTLPQSNDQETTIGVFYRDTSASKIDYYFDSRTSTSCATDGSSITTTVTFALDLDQATADAQPAYVKSGHWGSDFFRTQLFVYGPVGATVVGQEELEVGRAMREGSVVDDLGRPVARWETDLEPGETASMSVTFALSPEQRGGPLTVRSTPTLRPAEDVIDLASCESVVTE